MSLYTQSKLFVIKNNPLREEREREIISWDIVIK